MRLIKTSVVASLVLSLLVVVGCNRQSSKQPSNHTVAQRNHTDFDTPRVPKRGLPKIKEPTLPKGRTTSDQPTPKPKPQPAAKPQPPSQPPVSPPKPTGPNRKIDYSKRMPLFTFDAPELPKNKRGDLMPSWYFNPNFRGHAEGGKFNSRLISAGSVRGKCLELLITAGLLYAQFNPYGNSTRDFMRAYSVAPDLWKFNHYNRLRIWIKAPAEAPPPLRTGQFTYNVGTYVKRIHNADSYSDEAGGGHYYHHFNIPNNGYWTQLILNMHPSHRRGIPGGQEVGNLPHPTGEAQYNYFDTLTRFYVHNHVGSYKSHPASFYLDEIEFLSEPRVENDEQVFSIAASYDPQKHAFFLSWSRPKNENKIRHEVRYAFHDIHTIGWENAKQAPNGIVRPLGWQGYNGMIYETDKIDVRGHGIVYFAIKPQNATRFSQVAVPLDLR